MQARLLLAIFDSVYLFALASWIGSILFFSFGVAPILFKVLDAPSAARFVRTLFPRYYAWGVVSSGIALPAYLGVPLSFPEYRGWWVGVQAMLIVASVLIFLYCGNTLTPAINTARDAGPDEATRFNQLHKRSVRLNAVVLLIGIVLLVVQATRRHPETDGIIEMTPQERLGYDSQALDYLRTKMDSRAATPGASVDQNRFPFDEAAKKELDDIVAAKRERQARKRGASKTETAAPDRP